MSFHFKDQNPPCRILGAYERASPRRTIKSILAFLTDARLGIYLGAQ